MEINKYFIRISQILISGKKNITQQVNETPFKFNEVHSCNVGENLKGIIQQ